MDFILATIYCVHLHHPVLSGLSILPPLLKQNLLEINGAGFLKAAPPSCHPTNSVKALKGSKHGKITNSTHWPQPLSIHSGLMMEDALFP